MASVDIPSIDFSKLPDSKDVSVAMSNLGFLFIKNADVPNQELVHDMFAISQGFFEGESLEEKEKVSVTVQNRGWIGNRQEALDTKVHPTGDLKEAFNLSKFTTKGQPMQPLPPTLDKHLPDDYFTSRHAYNSQHSSILRLLYYPPSNLSEDQVQGQIRAGAHSDYGSLTLLFQKSLGGLQVQLPNGEWLDAPVVDDAVLVNIGDLFDFWSGGRYPSTVHRVALPTGREASRADTRSRTSWARHPTDDVLLSRIPIKDDDKEEQHARNSRVESPKRGSDMNGGMHVNGDSDSQAGPSSSSSSSATGRDGPGPDPTLHMDSYSLDELPELIEQQPTIQAEIRTTVSPSELHSLSPHPIPLDTDGRPMHSPDTLDDGLGMAVDAHMGEGEDDWAPAEEWATAEMRRVKVYELKGACWNDRGTGMCSADYDDTTEKAVILVKSEFTDVELLRCEIQAQDVYQRQQGEQGDLGQTLIVWTEPNGTDFASQLPRPRRLLVKYGTLFKRSSAICEANVRRLSFVPPLVCHAHDHLEDPTSSSPPSTPKVSLERRFAQSFMQAGQIPPPEFNNIGDIDRAIKFLSKNPALKEKICETLVYQKFICSLIELFCEAERSESLQHLHTLCRIMQTIIMLNEHPMYEHMLSDEIFPGVLGMLEYDPEFPDHKASYRHFLSYVAHYREAVPIRDSVVRKKIHQTYRLLFLKDVVLARMLDDPTFNILNSFIIFNQMDIVTHFQHEETILPRMFSAFPRLFTKDGKSSLETHEDPTNIPSDFQPQLNGAGNSSPVIGPMPSPDYSAISSDQDTRRKDIIRMTHQLCSTAKNVQVTTRFALYRLLVDRGVLYAIQWAFSVHNPNPDMVSVQHLCGDILLSVMEYDPHGVRQNILQHSEAGVRTLLEQMIATMGSTKDLALRSQISDALRVLLEVQGAGGDMSVGERSGVSAAAKAAMGRREDPATERFLQYFYEQCIISLYKPVLALPDFTALQGRTPNQFVTRHLIKQDVVLPIIELTARESRRDNMLSSTCQEFFEYIRRENLRLVIDYMIDKHEARVRELAKHPMVEPPSTESVANSTNGNSTRRWGSGRHMDSEEEDYFNGADDETTERARVALGAVHVGAPDRTGAGRRRLSADQTTIGRTTGSIRIRRRRGRGRGGRRHEPNAMALGFQNVLSPSPMSVDAVSSPKDSSSSSGSPGSLERERKLTRSAAFIADSPTAARLADMQSDSVGNSDQMDTFPTLLEGGPPPLAQLRAEKRRREEEEDELLALYSNGKRAEGSKASANGPGAGQGPDVEEDTFPLAGKAGAPEGGTKKIKLSLGKGAAAVAAGSPAPSMSPTPTSSSTPPSTDSGGARHQVWTVLSSSRSDVVRDMTITFLELHPMTDRAARNARDAKFSGETGRAFVGSGVAMRPLRHHKATKGMHKLGVRISTRAIASHISFALHFPPLVSPASLCQSQINLDMLRSSLPCCFASSKRTATLVLAGLGAVGNAYAAIHLVALWWRMRKETESEWEGSADIWTLDIARVLGALVCTYMTIASVACAAGFYGTLKRLPAHVRVFRDYSIADLVFVTLSTLMFAFACVQPTLRGIVCEELSRQPELMRNLIDAGLTIENCDIYFERGVVGIVGVMSVLLICRMQFTLLVTDYYSQLLRAGPGADYEEFSGGEESTGHRIYLLPSQGIQSKDQPLVYAPLPRLSLAEARQMHAREAYVSRPSRHSHSNSLPHSSSRSHGHSHRRAESLSASRHPNGSIALPIRPGEGLI
ncbi:hypothetical protein RHS01_01941 [Rhizoctonia solani]|uniref:Fe2OG dioxygenase domain-containing protein n=1 Tax=Rhizoctonia solani TaxID=456999 RepID=A0A8H7M896_9AGAM|nr:hypothetical protein RHS01_01941 [Rhizoctonia solani]